MIDLRSKFVVVDVSLGKVLTGLCDAEEADKIAKNVIAIGVLNGIPEDRQNIRVMNLEEAMRGEYKPL